MRFNMECECRILYLQGFELQKVFAEIQPCNYIVTQIQGRVPESVECMMSE